MFKFNDLNIFLPGGWDSIRKLGTNSGAFTFGTNTAAFTFSLEFIPSATVSHESGGALLSLMFWNYLKKPLVEHLNNVGHTETTWVDVTTANMAAAETLNLKICWNINISSTHTHIINSLPRKKSFNKIFIINLQ